MRVIVAGASSLGVSVARQLIEADHQVVIIDRDKETLDLLSDELDCGFIVADATLPTTLREAGGETFDVVMALMESDEDNILCALVARSVRYQKVIPQIINPELCAICDELDLTDIITPHETVAASLVDMLDKSDEPEHDAHLLSTFRLVSYQVIGNLEGRRLQDFAEAGDAWPVALARGEDQQIAAADTTVRVEDTITLLCRRADGKAVLERLQSEDRTEED